MHRHRLLTAGLAMGLLAGAVRAETLGIGDQAPKLEVSHWLKGDPVDLAKVRGKSIVVVEFWATWCGPCVAAVPHLTELQHKYADKGVIVVGVTSEDPNNTLERVKAFVSQRGDDMGYRVGFDKPAKMDRTFMEAAGQTGIPTAFVIDKSGRVAWIGHPDEGLEKVVAKLVAGTFDIDKARKTFALQAKIQEAMYEEQWVQVFKLADQYIEVDAEAVAPWLIKMQAHLMLDEPAKALKVAERAVGAFANSAENLSALAGMLVISDQDHDHEHQAGEPSGEQQGAFNKLALAAANKAAVLAPNDAAVRAGQYAVLTALDRQDEALVVAEQTIGLLKDKGTALGMFARQLASPNPKHRCNDLALRAVDLAIAAQPEEARHLQTKFFILAACKQNIEAARKIGHYLLEKASSDAALLDGFSWSLLTDAPLMGKFNKLALLAAEKSHQLSGGTNWSFIDTLALAKFENGLVDEAIELEKKAIQMCPEEGPKRVFAAALERFEGAK